MYYDFQLEDVGRQQDVYGPDPNEHPGRHPPVAADQDADVKRDRESHRRAPGEESRQSRRHPHTCGAEGLQPRLLLLAAGHDTVHEGNAKPFMF